MDSVSLMTIGVVSPNASVSVKDFWASASVTVIGSVQGVAGDSDSSAVIGAVPVTTICQGKTGSVCSGAGSRSKGC